MTQVANTLILNISIKYSQTTYLCLHFSCIGTYFLGVFPVGVTAHAQTHVFFFLNIAALACCAIVQIITTFPGAKVLSEMYTIAIININFYQLYICMNRSI